MKEKITKSILQSTAKQRVNAAMCDNIGFLLLKQAQSSKEEHAKSEVLFNYRNDNAEFMYMVRVGKAVTLYKIMVSSK